MQTILFTAYTKEELRALLRDVLKEANILPIDIQQDSDTLLTRKEAAVFLSISLVTLRDWTKRGFVKERRVGNRVYYSKNELLSIGMDRNE